MRLLYALYTILGMDFGFLASLPGQPAWPASLPSRGGLHLQLDSLEIAGRRRLTRDSRDRRLTRDSRNRRLT